MATVGGSNQPQYNGKLGRVVYYMLNGVLVARGIGEYKGPPSVAQLSSRMATKMVCAFIEPLKPFFNIGYELLAKKNNSSPHNEAYSYHIKNALKGEYPNLEIDYRKVIMSTGGMPLPLDVAVAVTDEGLWFTWNQKEEVFGAHWTDHVMLAAYFPATNKAIYFTAGARRNQGAELLPLRGFERGQPVETYFSCIADDRTRVATSLYTGRLLW